MKIRNGFVSNSSSSSFVVAFPRKPKTVEETLKMLFGNDVDGSVQKYNDYVLTNKQIAEIVFNDLKDQRSISLKQISEEFTSRYYCLSNSHCEINEEGALLEVSNCKSDPDNWYGCNLDLLYAARDIEEEREKNSRTENKEYWRIMDRITNAVAPEMNDPKFKKYPRSDEENKELDQLHKKLSAACDADEEMIENRKMSWASHNRYWEKEREVTNALAKDDASRFKEDNKGKFIACFSYEDDCSNGVVMEQGDVFKNLPNVKISHH